MTLVNKILTIATAALLAGCMQTDPAECPEPTPDSPEDPSTPALTQGSAYVQLRLHVSSGDNSSSRGVSGPTGGEDGDGRVTATADESSINNVVMLLYESENNINDAGNATIKYAIPFEIATDQSSSSSSGQSYDATYVTEPYPFDPEDLQKNYCAIIIANTTDGWGKINGQSISSDCNELLHCRLSMVRDIVATTQWQESDNTISGFLMSSEKNLSLTLDAIINKDSAAGSEEDPWEIETVIERLAARLDFDTTGALSSTTASSGAPNKVGPQASACDYKATSRASDNPSIIYPVYNGNDQQIGTFTLSSISIVHRNANSGAYLIKRVADDESGTGISYLGDETASNYVLSYCGGGNTSTDLLANTKEYKSTDWAEIADSESSPVYRIEYLQENVRQGDDYVNSTGLLFTGTLTVNATSSDDATSDSSEASSGSDGSASSSAVGDGSTSTKTFYTKTYPYLIRHNDPEGQYNSITDQYPWLANVTDGSWDDIAMPNYPLSQFTNGTLPAMTFGIVRNNIYRVSIEKIYAEVEPNKTPGVDTVQIVLKIVTHPWSYYRHSAITM